MITRIWSVIALLILTLLVMVCSAFTAYITYTHFSTES